MKNALSLKGGGNGRKIYREVEGGWERGGTKFQRSKKKKSRKRQKSKKGEKRFGTIRLTRGGGECDPISRKAKPKRQSNYQVEGGGPRIKSYQIASRRKGPRRGKGIKGNCPMSLEKGKKGKG